MTLLNAVRREIWAVDRSVALTFTGSLTEYLKRFSYAEPQFGLVVMGVFAGVGLVLVALGVYSVLAYTVSRQTQEIGIRMALGAGSADVLRMVMRMGLRLVGLGLAVGLVVTLAATRVLASQLWGISAQDPADAGRRGGGDRGGGDFGVLLPGAAGHARGSHGRAEI